MNDKKMMLATVAKMKAAVDAFPPTPAGPDRVTADADKINALMPAGCAIDQHGHIKGTLPNGMNFGTYFSSLDHLTKQIGTYFASTSFGQQLQDKACGKGRPSKNGLHHYANLPANYQGMRIPSLNDQVLQAYQNYQMGLNSGNAKLAAAMKDQAQALSDKIGDKAFKAAVDYLRASGDIPSTNQNLKQAA
jgi:hypothetical protein